MTNTWGRKRKKHVLQQQIDQIEDNRESAPVKMTKVRHEHATVFMRCVMRCVQIATREGDK